jgi:hypothetical protein
MHMASDAYGSILVTFLSVLTKTAEMISDTSGTPVNLVAKHWIKRISFVTYKSHCETFSDERIIINGTLDRAQDYSAFRKCVIDDTSEL